MQYPQMLRLAGRQYGLLRKDQARRFITERRWRRLQADGMIRRQHQRPRVFEIGTISPSWRQAVMSAILSRPGSVASHQTAARLWGLDITLAGLSITAPRSSNAHLEGVTVHRPRTHRPWQTVLGGLPVTTCAMTLFDLATVLDADELERVLDQALRDKLVRLRHLREIIEALGTERHKGAGVLSRLIEDRSSIHERMETREEFNFLNWINEIGLPLPKAQHRVRTNSRTRRVDFAYPDVRLAIEIDDHWSHHTPSDLTHGTDRDLELELAAWRVIHVRRNTNRELLRKALTNALATAGAFDDACRP